MGFRVDFCRSLIIEVKNIIMSNQKTRFSDEELQEFESLLLTKKLKTETQILELETQYQEITENGKDEKGQDNSGYDSQVKFLITYIDRSKKHLNDIENALHRIKQNNYGICTVTGKLINKQRLLAVPTTTKSLEGKELHQTS